MSKRLIRRLGMEKEFLSWKQDIKLKSIQLKKGDRVVLRPMDEHQKSYYWNSLHLAEGDVGIVKDVFGGNLGVDFGPRGAWFILEGDLRIKL